MREFLKGSVTPKDWLAVAGILGLTFAVAVAFFFFVQQKQMLKLADTMAVNATVKMDLARANDINDGIQTLRDETKNIEILVSEFEQRLPSRREISNLLSEFESMEAEYDIQVEFSPLDRILDNHKETIPYRVVARGSFHNVSSFINQLERFKRFLKISDLYIISIKDAKIEAQFTLNTYRFIQNDSQGEAA